MSKEHPVISITGSSGAGTTTVKNAFQHIFARLGLNAVIIEGDSFHRYDRKEMRQRIEEFDKKGLQFSHFSAEANLLDELETLFRQYGENGGGKIRRYLHTLEEAVAVGQEPGTFTPWEEVPKDSDLLFYEGLHGAAVSKTADVAKYADLVVGVVPIINLEWIQKIHRDINERGYRRDEVTDTILRRMYDYVHMITPQFSRTDINFQRVPTVDTSNPFITRYVPTPDESFVVIRFKEPKKFEGIIDFPYLVTMLHDSFMSRRNTIVIPGGKMGLAIEIIFMPLIEKLMRDRQS